MSSQNKLTDYVSIINSSNYSNKPFKTTKFRCEFAVENIQEASNPEDVLKECLQYCIDQTRNNSIQSNMEIDQIGLNISSILLDYDIYVPIRRITENTTDAILNLFYKVSQSKGRDGSLLGEPFSVIVTGIRSKDLPESREITGRGFKSEIFKRRINDACLIKIDNKDRYCLFYALEIMRIRSSGEIRGMQFSRYKNKDLQRKQDVLKLLTKTNIPTNLSSYDAKKWCPIVQEYYNQTYGEGIFKIFIFKDNSFKPIYSSDEKSYQYPILLYYHDNHFDGIKTISKFFNRRHYCLSCEAPYDRDSRHKANCKSRCINCGSIGPDFPCEHDLYPEFNNTCQFCNKEFRNKTCFRTHNLNNFCRKSKRCTNPKCRKIWNIDKHPQGHNCNEKFCFRCKKFHEEGSCFIQKYFPKKPKPFRIIAYDFESEQIPQYDLKQSLKHNVNFVCAKIFCTECITNDQWNLSLKESCEICGENRTITWAPFNFFETEVDRHIITDSPLSDFTKWILYEQNNRYPTYAFAHYGGRYDCTLIFGEIIQRGIVPELIRQGNRLYEMKVNKSNGVTKTFFRDSFNYVSQKLDSLVKAFDLPIQNKGHFPHMFNKSENYNKLFDNLPPKDDYLYKSKKPVEKEAFEKWYEEHYNDGYDFNEVIAEYCVNDVQILSHALVALRNTFHQITKREGKHAGIDILRESMTIASACMKAFRLNHLKPNHLAIVPENSYEPKFNQSLLAIKFLSWYSEKNSIELRTALSDQGEKRLGPYLLDGYNEERKLGIEVHGCYFHGCIKCYPDDQTELAHKKSAEHLREKNAEREEYLKRNLNELEIFYECEIKEQLKTYPEMKKFFEQCIDEGPINLRDALFGGRTGPMKIFHNAKPGEKISYKDVRSLYPFTNFKTPYPIGHPTKKVFKRSEQEVNWTKPEHNPYHGVLKVLLVPPKNLRVPVMPTRIGKDDLRLLFTLCKKCAKMYPEGDLIDDYVCKHTEEERQFVSTCTSIELNESLQVGYKVKRIYRVLEYKHFDDTIFKNYVREFFKIKLEASGFEKEFDTLEKQDQFLKECLKLFGVNVERDNMKFNAALRTLAKICLNSLWGRFALRNFLSKTFVTDDPYDLYLYFNDPKIEISSLDQLTEDIFMITYDTKEDFIEEHDCSNVVLSLYTTSAARITLLKLLQKVDATPGCEILYMDTDSVIYVHPEDNDPLPTGPHLGDLTDECLGKTIVEFVSAGCKNYAMMLRDANNPNAKPEYILKIRGITLDYNTCQILQYDTFKSKVLNYCKDIEPIIVKYDNFLRPNLKRGSVFTVPLEKKYRPIICKGIVNNNYQVVNFGTCNP